MALILRKIAFSKWKRVLHELEPDDIEADAVLDFCSRLKDNKLSVFLLNDASNVGRVLVALAATQESPDDYGYALIPEELVQELGIELEENDATTPDMEVNKWHRNMTNLSGKKITFLSARARRGDGCRLEPFPSLEMAEELKNSLENTYMKRDDIKIKNKKLRAGSGLPELNQ